MCWWSCESWHKMLRDATRLLFRTIAGFLLKFMSDILFESCLNESSAAWCLTHCSNRCSCSALILWAEEVLMTQWLLISSLLLLSRCAPDFFIFFLFFRRLWWKHLILLTRAHVRHVFPLWFIYLFWHPGLAIAAAHLPTIDWLVGNWRLPEDTSIMSDLKMYKLWFLNWQTLYLRDGNEDKWAQVDCGEGYIIDIIPAPDDQPSCPLLSGNLSEPPRRRWWVFGGSRILACVC